MNKQLKITYNGQEYTLEYTRRTVTLMEQQGFVVSDIDNKPMSTLPKLFAGAFKANHRYIRDDMIDEIFEHIPNKTELIGKLAEMYAEPIKALVDEPEDAQGNASWTADW